MSTVDEFKNYDWRSSSPKTILPEMREDLDRFKGDVNFSQEDEEEWQVYSDIVTRLENEWAKADKSTPKNKGKAQEKLNQRMTGTSLNMMRWMKNKGYLTKELRYFRRGFEPTKESPPPQYSEKDPFQDRG